MTDALLLTVLGMGVVFVVLLLISLMLSFFPVLLPNKEQKAAAPTLAPVLAPIRAVPDKKEEIVAAITAAVTLYMGDKNFKIHSISPLVVRPLVTGPENSPWSNAAIAENNHR